MVIGVAGYMGAGKSLAASLLVEHYGAALLDGDVIARELMLTDDALIAAVGARFGVVDGGAIDFAALGGVVFADAALMAALNEIVHPVLIAELRKRCEEHCGMVVIDAAPLPLWIDQLPVDGALWLDASVESRVARVMARNGIDESAARFRIEGQHGTIPEPTDGAPWTILSNEESLTHLGSLLNAYMKRRSRAL